MKFNFQREKQATRQRIDDVGVTADIISGRKSLDGTLASRPSSQATVSRFDQLLEDISEGWKRFGVGGDKLYGQEPKKFIKIRTLR